MLAELLAAPPESLPGRLRPEHVDLLKGVKTDGATLLLPGHADPGQATSKHVDRVLKLILLNAPPDHPRVGRLLRRLPYLSLDVPEAWAWPVGLKALTAAPKLDEVHLTGCVLTTLSAAPALRSLALERCVLPADLSHWRHYTGRLWLADTPVPLGAFDGAPIERLQLVGQEMEDLSEMGALPELKMLELRRCPGLRSLHGLAGAPKVEEAWIRDNPALVDITEIGALSELGMLTLEGSVALRDLSGLARCQALHRLDLSGCSTLAELGPLATLTALQRLSLDACCAVEDLTPLRALSALKDLDLRGCDGLRDLQGLPQQAKLTALRLDGLATLERLTGLSPAPRLTRFTLRALAALSELDGIEAARGLEVLTLEGLTQPLDLSALARLRKLRELRVVNCPGVVDVSPLAGARALRCLDLRGCPQLTDVSGLAEVADPPVLFLHGSGVKRRAVPASLRWRCAWGEAPDLDRMLRKKRPPEAALKGPPKASVVKRPTVTALRQALRDDVEGSLSTLRELGDAQLYEAVLRGVELAPMRCETAWDGSPERLRHPGFPGSAGADALHRLIAQAPDTPWMRKLRRSVTRLDLAQRGQQPISDFDLNALAAFPKLRRLSFHREGALHAADGLALPKLEAFSAFRVLGALRVAFLANSPALCEVELRDCGGWDMDLTWVRGATWLRRLWLRADLEDLSALAAHPTLSELRLQGSWALEDLSALATLPKLTHLELLECRGLQSLDALVGCSALTELHVRRHELSHIGALPPALRKLVIGPRGAVSKEELEALRAGGLEVELRGLRLWRPYP